MKRIAFLVAIALMVTPIVVLAQGVTLEEGKAMTGLAPLLAVPEAYSSGRVLPAQPAQGVALGGRDGNNAYCFEYQCTYAFLEVPDVVNAPNTQNLITYSIMGDEFAADFGMDLSTLYVIHYSYNALYSLDITTGTQTYIGPCVASSSAPYWTGLTYALDTDTWYATSTSGSVSYLYTIDITTGTATALGQLPTANCAAIIDCAYRLADGLIYSLDMTINQLVQINPVALTAVSLGALGPGVDITYAQGHDWDDQQDMLYLAVYNSAVSQGWWYRWDPSIPGVDTTYTVQMNFGCGTGTYAAEADGFAVHKAGMTSDGLLSLDKSLYGCADVVGIKVMDSDLVGTGTLVVTVDNTTTGDNESVTLTEDPGLLGTFNGTIPTGAGGPSSGNGILELNNGDGIMATYIDANDGSGGINVPKYAYATADCVGPVISGVVVGCPGDTFLGISWTTDELSNSTVNYGLTPALGSSTTVTGKFISHTVTLTGLTVNSLYYFEVCSTDEANNTSCDNNGGAYYTASTLYSISSLPWGQVRGVAVDGATGNVFFANYPLHPPTDSAAIVQMTDAGSVVSTFIPVSTNVQGLGFDGTNLWLSVGGATPRVYQMTTTGGLINFFSPWGVVPVGVGYEASTVWVADQGGTPPSFPNLIYSYTTSGSYISTFAYPGWDVNGFGHYNGLGYAVDVGNVSIGPGIYEMDDTGSVIQWWCSADSAPWGIDAAGGYLWYSGQTADKLFRLTLPTAPPTPTSTTPLPIPTTGSTGMAIALALFSALLIGQRALRRASR